MARVQSRKCWVDVDEALVLDELWTLRGSYASVPEPMFRGRGPVAAVFNWM